VTAAHAAPLRVALLQHGGGPPAADLAAALRAAGHSATLVEAAGGGAARLADGLLRRRGFAVPLAHVPAAVRALAAAGPDVVHAFTPADATAALLWRRSSGRPVVFTPAEPVDRAGLADRRLRLQLVTAAIEQSDAVTAASEASRAALWRWLALDAPLLDPGDAASHERLYRRLLG
jgi:hypothetical protein